MSLSSFQSVCACPVWAFQRRRRDCCSVNSGVSHCCSEQSQWLKSPLLLGWERQSCSKTFSFPWTHTWEEKPFFTLLDIFLLSRWMSCLNWCCLWAGISILSIWAEFLAWRFLSAWSAFHQWVCPWVLKYGYLYSSLKLAEFSTSCDGCALAGAVFLPPTLPFFRSVSLEWKQFLFPFHVCYFFWDFFSNSPALEKEYLPERIPLCLSFCSYSLWIKGCNTSLVLAL